VDFRDDVDTAEFRSAVRHTLERIVAEMGPEPTVLAERVPRFRRFQGLLHDAGYAGLAWPEEYGGRGANLTNQAAFLQEYDRAGAPDRLNAIGEYMVGPTIIDFGTDAQKERLLRPILAGEHIWCQLYSEPAAGSDLAGLTTRAERDGDSWRIRGQKVWTSRAQIAAFGLLLARTGGGARHRGITCFLLPMDSPGVTVRPLRHMLGEAEFNEVFFDDVPLSDDLRVGEVDGGWRVAMATLSYERVSLATGRVNMQNLLGRLVELVRSGERHGAPLVEDRAVRLKLADLYARARIQQVNGWRALASMDAGSPGPEASIGKLFSAPLVEDVADFACSLAGLDAQIDEEDGPDPWQRLAYQARGTSIAGGTTFIQRNIVAERALGLPR
jgi:alkylation response protein AidB-like acyl-CoA dehydrogenase